ncbi:hypothetical protein HanXRQr2_Chr06g0269611 [Helianthus annuus]|uniref:Peptide chain release factor 2 n=1 Tax=Helianthus annuus TaxID=4232 RepID=A0A9K3IUV9_HELAN|nr:hypothetical protein HanXRQr2_Chr06g0269611 [Helianthus annuus]KAJ0916317.1 hypothetical protein HanPSC8_Chr06g0260241 [Helianthus annuus]
MSSIIFRRSHRTSSSILSRYQSFSTLFQSPSDPQSTNKQQNHVSGFESLSKNASGFGSVLNKRLTFSCGSCLISTLPFSSQAAVATTDGLTVDDIVANQRAILDESESDWKSHASAWTKLKVRLEMLSFQMEKPDLWDDPVHAGRISREHGSLMGKMKEVNGLEQELIDHIDMIKLSHEENDPDLESVGPQILF